ncbi:oxidoreductase domain protein [Aminomonas paucivorans DSM 12260]|uniref:Oxidoreductase domain protein n=1 Tax=Aminomonas paucivorans DSM 12260 TaxID=584708 RepID=E3CVY1_9BACT|nr:Gfo/Idh/MocA family oxidoreductase [Aminomonas paucivorans]EFQ24236.1 oxidoreductase domain protein [Aminomonas paucivorans DSM 12260]
MLRIALVGCGRISKNHIEAIEALRQEGKAQLVGVCDLLSDRAEAAAAVAGSPCRPFTDYATMLREVECDLVSLCTPSGLHPRHAIQAARAGRHVLSEKPLGTSLAAVDEAIRVCDEAGVLYMEVKQNRLNPPIRLLRRALEAGRFGRLHMITANVFWTRPQEYYDQAPWRGTWEFDGGCLSNQAAHYVDMVQWMGGSVEQVFALSSTLGRRIEAEDTITVGLKFRSGAIGSINVSVLTYPRNLEGSITVMGERGTVRVGGVAMNRIEQWQFADDDVMDQQVKSVGYEPKSVYGSGHKFVYENVLNAAVGVEAKVVNAREGRKTVELIEGVYGFAESKRG